MLLWDAEKEVWYVFKNKYPNFYYICFFPDEFKILSLKF